MSNCKSCGESTVGSAPFYEEVGEGVIEDHKTILSDTCYAVGVRTPDDWNIPEVDSDISIKIADVTLIPVGTYLYNPAYGFLKITNWNPRNDTIGVLNEGITGTAAAGSFVPANSLFVVTAKPCCEDNTADLFPYLAEDFTAPDPAQSRTVEVTSTFGLQLGTVIRIGSGLYRLEQINSSRQIVITNEGAGATPGTLVEALNAEGEYQYLIVIENASACAAAESDIGRLIVCDSSDERILSGNYAGQVPVLQDASSSEVLFEFLDADIRVCAELTANMIVLSATSDYTIAVSSVLGFVIGDILQLNFNTLRFIITAIGVSSFDVSSTPAAPGVDTTILAGSAVCKVLTSETILAALDGSGAGLQAQINNLQTQIDNLNTYYVTVAGNLTNEISARIAADAAITTAYGLADTTLQTNITTEAATRSAADTAESAARIAADNTLTSGVTLSLKKDGSNVPTANLPMATFRHTGVGDGVVLTDYPSVKQVQNSTPLYGGTSSGASNVYAITLSPAPTAYVVGQRFTFFPHQDNTGSATANFNTLGAKTIIDPITGTFAEAGRILTGVPLTLMYDGSNMLIVSPLIPNYQGATGAGSNQGTATGLIADHVFASNSTLNAGFRLPPATRGRVITISLLLTNTTFLYPASGDQINVLGTNTGQSISTGSYLYILIADDTSNWHGLIIAT